MGRFDSDGSADVSSAGDVNGDGFDDILVGSTVLFGKRRGFAPYVDLSEVNGKDGFHVGLGRFVESTGAAGAGDVNGDGFDDIIVNRETRNYVIFGKAQGWTREMRPASINGSNGFMIGINRSYGSEDVITVNGAGDVNGDGFADVLVHSEGDTSVVFGHANAFPRVLPAGKLNGVNGFLIRSDYGDWGAVSSAGDVNGDGFSDLIVSSTNYPGSEAAFIYFGHGGRFPKNFNTSRFAGKNGFALSAPLSEYAGMSVSGAGDINGDGFDDMLVGAPGASLAGENSGSCYVVFGRRDFQAFNFFRR
jgi:hypothetical protein